MSRVAELRAIVSVELGEIISALLFLAHKVGDLYLRERKTSLLLKYRNVPRAILPIYVVISMES